MVVVADVHKRLVFELKPVAWLLAARLAAGLSMGFVHGLLSPVAALAPPNRRPTSFGLARRAEFSLDLLGLSTRVAAADEETARSVEVAVDALFPGPEDVLAGGAELMLLNLGLAGRALAEATPEPRLPAVPAAPAFGLGQPGLGRVGSSLGCAVGVVHGI